MGQIRKRRLESEPARWRHLVWIGALQLALVAHALTDIRRRPAQAINGGRAMWMAFVFFNGIGPLVYYLLGRKPTPLQSDAERSVP